MPKYSIVIGTFNHFEDCLKPCLDNLLKYTTLNDFSTELIIVANGCTDETCDYVRSLQAKFHGINLLEFKEPLGFPVAYNEGIKSSKGEYIILLNNDTQLLNQPYNQWLDILSSPFSNPLVGITGPMKEHCPYADEDFILFFCVMISRKVVEKIGLLDTIFSPGIGEDTDYCIKAQKAGFKIVQVPDESRQFYDTLKRTGNFPIWHAGTKTFANWEGGEELIRRNSQILEERYGKKKGIIGREGHNDPVGHPGTQGIKGETYLAENGQGYVGVSGTIEKAIQCDGYMSLSELAWLALQASKSQIVIEIGSWHGRSSRALADNLPPDGTLYCVDTWKGSSVEQDTNHASAKLNEGDHAFMEFCDNMADHIQAGRVIPIRMSSKNASKFFSEHNIQADLIFIDAGHTKDEVREDIGFWWSAVKKGGILSGHDYNYTDGMWAGVTAAVDESVPGVNQIDNGNIWWSNSLHDRIKIEDDPLLSNIYYKPSIYDCFPFFNELDILDIRFAELYDKVDRFVITEATLTHGGKPKPLYFKENLSRYEKYLNKVTHIIVDQYPALDSWSIERHQRDQLMRGLTQCKDDDVIMISDADEIIKASAIDKFNPSIGVMGFQQNLYYYKLNCKGTAKWDWAKIATYKNVRDRMPCGIRYTPTTKANNLIKNGGWHFSYLSSIDGIIEKLEATAHQEYNLPELKDRKRVEEKVNTAQDLFNRPLDYTLVLIDSTYPKYVLQNLEYFENKDLVAQLELV